MDAEMQRLYRQRGERAGLEEDDLAQYIALRCKGHNHDWALAKVQETWLFGPDTQVGL